MLEELIELKEPYLHLTDCDNIQEKIYKNFDRKRTDDFFIASIDGKKCNKKKELFKELSVSFKFPNYFGYNWDALDECICDLEWLGYKKGYILILFNTSDILKSNNRDFNIFINILKVAINNWINKENSKEINPIPFHIILQYNKKDRELILKRLYGIGVSNVDINELY